MKQKKTPPFGSVFIQYFFNMSFNINPLIRRTPCRGRALFHKQWFEKFNELVLK